MDITPKIVNMPLCQDIIPVAFLTRAKYRHYAANILKHGACVKFSRRSCQSLTSVYVEAESHEIQLFCLSNILRCC